MGRACGLSLVAVLALLVLGSGEARAASASVSVVEGYRGRQMLPEDCENVDLGSMDASRPRLIDDHPRLDVARAHPIPLRPAGSA